MIITDKKLKKQSQVKNTNLNTSLRYYNKGNLVLLSVKPNSPVCFLVGPTGSGKSQNIFNSIYELLSLEDTDTIIVYALPNKDQVNRALLAIQENVSTEQFKFVVDYVSGSFSEFLISRHDDTLSEDVDPLPKVVLTSHAYLSTRGDSCLLYQFHVDMMWLSNVKNKKLRLYIDESHIFLDSLKWSLKYQGYYEEKYGFENSSFIVPTKRKSISGLDASIKDKISLQKTLHCLSLDKEARNPKISSDKITNQTNNFVQHNFPALISNVDIYKLNEHKSSKLKDYNNKSKLKDSKPKLKSVTYLDYTYTILDNNNFTTEAFSNDIKFKFQILKPKISEAKKKVVNSMLQKVGTNNQSTSFDVVVDAFSTALKTLAKFLFK